MLLMAGYQWIYPISTTKMVLKFNFKLLQNSMCYKSKYIYNICSYL